MPLLENQQVKEQIQISIFLKMRKGTFLLNRPATAQRVRSSGGRMNVLYDLHKSCYFRISFRISYDLVLLWQNRIEGAQVFCKNG